MKQNFGVPLSRNEMKNVMGGYVAPPCDCKCNNGMPGEWFYTHDGQPSNTYLHNDINTYCGSTGGTCTGCTHWAA